MMNSFGGPVKSLLICGNSGFACCMNVGRGDAASKTERIYLPPPRTAYEAADKPRFILMAPASLISLSSSSTWVQLCITHYSLISDANG